MSQKTLGAALMIAGVTVGAGMLALPMTSSEMGFLKSAALLSGLWLYMVIVALIMVEISHGKPLSIAALAKKRLGPIGKHVAAGSLLVLFWALLAAYISGGSSFLSNDLQWNAQVSSIVYVVLFGACAVACTKLVDYANRFLFIVKVTVFAVMIFGLFPMISLENLKPRELHSVSSFLKAIPVFFTSFGFHGSIPTLVGYLDGSRKNLYRAVIWGSFIPLVVYVLWQSVTLGVLGDQFTSFHSLSGFIQVLTQTIGNQTFKILADVFGFFAITTSFLGVALGLFNYVTEWFAKDLKEKISIERKLKVAVITFGLPVLFSLFYPAGFIFALGFAAIPLSLLAAVLPSLVALKEEKPHSRLLGKGFLLVALVIGLAIIGVEIYEKLS